MLLSLLVSVDVVGPETELRLAARAGNIGNGILARVVDQLVVTGSSQPVRVVSDWVGALSRCDAISGRESNQERET